MAFNEAVKLTSAEVAAEKHVDADLRVRLTRRCTCRAESDLMIPEVPSSVMCINGFALLRSLGRGAYGKVHEAALVETCRPDRLAVKSYDKAALRKVWVGGGIPGRRPPTALDRIVDREIPCWSRLCHPNLLALLEVVNDPSASSIRCVMQMAAGGCSMPDVAPSPPVHVSAVRVIAAQLLDALTAMHESGACHRDVKPSNILLLCDAQRARLLASEVRDAAAVPPAGLSCWIDCDVCGTTVVAPRELKPESTASDLSSDTTAVTAEHAAAAYLSGSENSSPPTGYPPVIVKLADFGEVLDMCTAEQGGGDLTRATTGTPAFQPPEMLVAGPPFSGRMQDAWCVDGDGSAALL